MRPRPQVANNAGATAPALRIVGSTALADGRGGQVQLLFNTAIAAGSAVPDDFVVTIDSVPVVVEAVRQTGPHVHPGHVWLRLATAPAAGQVVAVQHAPSARRARPPIGSIAGALATLASPRTVVNRVGVRAALAYVSSAVQPQDPRAVVVAFSDIVAAGTAHPDDFSVTADGAAIALLGAEQTAMST